MEQAEADGNRNDAIEALIECEMLDGAALGIAKKVVAENGLDGLSDKQKYVYETAVASQFEIACETEYCGNMISSHEVADAIRNQHSGEDVLCEECQYTFRDRGDDD
jgi:hypothetical protein